MAYQIDFTAQDYAIRRLRKILLRVLLLAAIGGLVYGVNYVYTTYNMPTLNMRLAEYEAVTHPIEEMNAAWDAAAKEYAAMVRYYRLVWAASPTNFLAAMASPSAPRLRQGLAPQSWTLATGGNCRLDLRYTFGTGDKAEQARGLEQEVAQSVTSVVQVADGKIDVMGVRHANLLNVDAFDITVQFALPNVRSFPAKEKTLAACVNEIAAMRKKVQETKFATGGDKGFPSAAIGIMMAYLSIGKDKADFPKTTDVLNIAGWFERADRFIVQNRIHGDDRERKRLKAAWNEIGEARFPWERFRILDNEELANRTKALQSVSDGVKKFKVFLDRRQADNRRKLEPFVEAYDHGDVFNKPLVESDLRDRVAAAAGISRVKVVFLDEPEAEPSILVKDDERFAFSWVRWTLSLGDATGRDAEKSESQGEADAEDQLTVAKLADCASRALSLGPGYAIDKVRVDFGENGSIRGAVLEGLLPVKKVEPLKEAKK